MRATFDSAETALQAIIARVDGRFDDPALLAFGPLSTDAAQDCKAIAASALAE